MRRPMLNASYRYTLAIRRWESRNEVLPIAAFGDCRTAFRTACVTGFRADSKRHCLNTSSGCGFLAAPLSHNQERGSDPNLVDQTGHAAS